MPCKKDYNQPINIMAHVYLYNNLSDQVILCVAQIFQRGILRQ